MNLKYLDKFNYFKRLMYSSDIRILLAIKQLNLEKISSNASTLLCLCARFNFTADKLASRWNVMQILLSKIRKYESNNEGSRFSIFNALVTKSMITGNIL